MDFLDFLQYLITHLLFNFLFQQKIFISSHYKARLSLMINLLKFRFIIIELKVEVFLDKF